MAEPSPRYTIYLLTVWHDSPNTTGNASDPAGWRFRLENPRTKEGKGFVGVAALTAGLVQLLQQESHPATTPERPEFGRTDAE
jgi:hypothetical protein